MVNFTARPIKSHTCSIGFISRDIAGPWNVSIASCCLNSLTMRGLWGLALLSIKISPSAKGWLSNWGTTVALSTLSRYATPLRLPCKTCKSNLQLKEKHSQTVILPPTEHCCTHHVAVMKWSVSMLHTRMQPSTGHNKNRLVWPMDLFPITNIPTKMVTWPIPSSPQMT